MKCVFLTVLLYIKMFSKKSKYWLSCFKSVLTVFILSMDYGFVVIPD